MPERHVGAAGRVGALGALALALALVACGQPAPSLRRLHQGAAPAGQASADVTGSVVGLDATTVRVQPAGGAPLVVATGAATAVFALAPGTSLDLAAGDRVAIAGARPRAPAPTSPEWSSIGDRWRSDA